MSELIDGVDIKLGRTVYTVPALSFKQLRTEAANIAVVTNITGIPTEDQMTAICQLVLVAMRRNYPDATLEQVEDSMDLSNAASVTKAIMGVSGLVQGEVAGSR